MILWWILLTLWESLEENSLFNFSVYCILDSKRNMKVRINLCPCCQVQLQIGKTTSRNERPGKTSLRIHSYGWGSLEPRPLDLGFWATRQRAVLASGRKIRKLSSLEQRPGPVPSEMGFFYLQNKIVFVKACWRCIYVRERVRKYISKSFFLFSVFLKTLPHLGHLT